LQRCIDTSKDQRGYILPLVDEDVIALVEEYQNTKDGQVFQLLRELWAKLIG
jgi:hypothetical protein